MKIELFHLDGRIKCGHDNREWVARLRLRHFILGKMPHMESY
jgi:hypothetical protein